MRLVPVALVLLLALVPLHGAADAGRAAPGCLTRALDDLAATVDVDSGVCIIVDLGVLTPGDVHDVEAIIVDDPIDLLFFDENGVQPYELGQSYRNGAVAAISTESALGGYEFHWKTPPSIAPKRWFAVLDNLAHDGDGGLGDQGGVRSRVAFSMTPLSESYWTPFHDTVAVDAGASSVLLSGDDLRLDAGTTVVLSAWELESIGDVYLQTRSMHDRYLAGEVGVQYIDGGAMQGVDGDQSVTWQVPSTLAGEELLLIVDNTDTPLGGGNGSQALRMTVRIELAPPLAPVVTDSGSGTVSLGQTLTLDAGASPNRLGQQGTIEWDFDANVDTNEDGNPTNDADGSGFSVDAIWALPGTKTVTVTNTAPSGETASVTHLVNVVDTGLPVPRIRANGTAIADGWRTNVGVPIALHCLSSTDDHTVARCDWTVDGQPQLNTTAIVINPDRIGNHSVMLTVTDPTGNTANTTATVRSVDPTLPSIDPDSVVNFPTDVDEGSALSFSIVVDDAFDDPTSLRVHWDLDPEVDSDGNGEFTDDPDRVGLNPSITFSTPGEVDIVVTVFDASNNTNTYAFTVDVMAVEQTPLPIGLAFVALAIVAAVVVGSAAGYRTVQRGKARGMLVARGLSVEEAKAHMDLVAQRRRLSFRATPEQHAGLDEGEVVSQAERQAAAKEAEMQAIYGGSTPAGDPNLAFAPPQQMTSPMSAPSSQVANEAAALLMEEGSMTSSPASSDALEAFYDANEADTASAEGASVVQPAAGAVPASAKASSDTQLVHGGVALPEGVVSAPASTASAPSPPPSPQPVAVRHACSACNAVFEVDVPAGLTQAIVACPSCDMDQTVRAET